MSSFLSLSIVFSGACIKASAAPSGGEYMSASDVLQFYGARISAQYYNGSDYTDFEFVYSSQSSIDSIYSSVSYPDSVYSGAPFLLYYADISNLPGYNTAVGHVTVQVTPQYSITNTSFIHTFIGLQDLGSNSDTYQSPSYDWVWSGDSVHLENSASDPSTSGGQACFGDSASPSSHLWYTFVPVDLTSSSTTSGYSVRASFSGNDVRGTANVLGLAVGIPYVSSGASGSSGTLPPVSSQPDINVNVDMSETNEKIDETNGLIGSILSWIGNFFVNLGNTVKGWFVPSQDFITNWVHRLIEIIEDKFAPWPVADQTIKDIVQRLLTALGEGGVQSVDFPTITIPGVPGGPFIEGRSVPLKGDNGAWADLIEVFASFVDVVCTIWVINMVCHRVKAVLVGEAVVEVEGSD